MGPNLYITPPSSFTHFHQDGFGTVDSGHLCLAGYNEIIMLRRLPLDHQVTAMNILTRGRCSNDPTMPQYDGLNRLPHGLDNVSHVTLKSIIGCPFTSTLFTVFPRERNHSGLMLTPLNNAMNWGKSMSMSKSNFIANYTYHFLICIVILAIVQASSS